ncbi:MAG: SRPBCC family protein [Myxococcota bacterium]
MLRVSRVIPAPAHRVWSLFTDTYAWPKWGPTVLDVACLTRFIGPGSRGSVKTPLGVWVSFQVLEFEPGRSWSWRVLGVPITGHVVEPLSASTSRATITLPYWAAPYAVVCQRALTKLARMA